MSDITPHEQQVIERATAALQSNAEAYRLVEEAIEQRARADAAEARIAALEAAGDRMAYLVLALVNGDSADAISREAWEAWRALREGDGGIMSDTASVQACLDAQIERLTALGLVPVSVVLSYTDHWRLSYHDLGGPDVGYPRPGAYATFAPSYRGLPIVRPGLAYDRPPAVGVRA